MLTLEQVFIPSHCQECCLRSVLSRFHTIFSSNRSALWVTPVNGRAAKPYLYLEIDEFDQ